MPQMKARQAHGWNQGSKRRGDRYEATEQEAQLLEALEWAERVEVVPERVKRQYHRRDMTAEN